MTKNPDTKFIDKTRLEDILNRKHGLYQLANRLNWDYLIENFGPYYALGSGRPSIPIRVLAGLHYLKYLENESDESIIDKFCENPYWQYFCGFKTFQHQPPCHSTTLVKWRKKVGIKGVEKLLDETINTAKRLALLPEKLCKKLNVDTTVQEKGICYPYDAKLLFKMRDKLVNYAKTKNIALRQTYVRVAKRALVKQGRYRHAGQMKRARKELRSLKTYLRRVTRDLERKEPYPDVKLAGLLELSNRLLKQEKYSKNKIYSLHAPEVECISKGKVHKKYEFGCKVSVATTCKEPWVVSISAEHGNPYDGHTLKSTLKRAEGNTGVKPSQVFVDKGYSGKKNYPKDVSIFKTGRKNLPRSLKALLKARAGIEPIIGHLKSDHRMNKNHLLGKVGDGINAVLSGSAFNLKKILRLGFGQELVTV